MFIRMFGEPSNNAEIKLMPQDPLTLGVEIADDFPKGLHGTVGVNWKDASIGTRDANWTVVQQVVLPSAERELGEDRLPDLIRAFLELGKALNLGSTDPVTSPLSAFAIAFWKAGYLYRDQNPPPEPTPAASS